METKNCKNCGEFTGILGIICPECEERFNEDYKWEIDFDVKFVKSFEKNGKHISSIKMGVHPNHIKKFIQDLLDNQ